jgi:hypothetical protein
LKRAFLVRLTGVAAVCLAGFAPVGAAGATGAPFPTPTHANMPVITLKMYTLLHGEGEQYKIYDDGAVIYYYEHGMRLTPVGYRTWKTGQLAPDELARLLSFVQEKGFLDAINLNGGSWDRGYKLTVNHGEIYKEFGSYGLDWEAYPEPVRLVFAAIYAVPLTEVGQESITILGFPTKSPPPIKEIPDCVYIAIFWVLAAAVFSATYFLFWAHDRRRPKVT